MAKKTNKKSRKTTLDKLRNGKEVIVCDTCTPALLKLEGFSKKYDGRYTKKLDLYKYKNQTMVYAILTIQDGEFNYSVYDRNTDTFYTPYYQQGFDDSIITNNNMVLKEVNNKLNNELNTLLRKDVLEWATSKNMSDNTESNAI